jgi:hypothetical protein
MPLLAGTVPANVTSLFLEKAGTARERWDDNLGVNIFCLYSVYLPVCLSTCMFVCLLRGTHSLGPAKMTLKEAGTTLFPDLRKYLTILLAGSS